MKIDRYRATDSLEVICREQTTDRNSLPTLARWETSVDCASLMIFLVANASPPCNKAPDRYRMEREYMRSPLTYYPLLHCSRVLVCNPFSTRFTSQEHTCVCGPTFGTAKFLPFPPLPTAFSKTWTGRTIPQLPNCNNNNSSDNTIITTAKSTYLTYTAIAVTKEGTNKPGLARPRP